MSDGEDEGTGRSEVPSEMDVRECRICGRKFSGKNLLYLHLGEEHRNEIEENEEETFREYRQLESETLTKFKIKALGFMVVVYFLLLFAFILFG
ncbi:MAG: hypothetical protein ABEK59_00670 [Halobacteria archaeon]